MVSNKKSYCMKLLHLALALSLLQVDPESYLFQQHLRNWDSQLDLSHGNGWELEMLRAVPMVPPEYPYANRKSMLPLIEDLVLYDRHHETDQLRTDLNVTAYQLFSDGSGSAGGVANNQNSSMATAALQELQVQVTNNAGTGTAASAVGNVATNEALPNLNRSNDASAQLDLFLSSDLLQDQRSLWEQNLADLQDFGDLSNLNPYANLPLKDELHSNNNINWLDINLEAFLPSFEEVNNRLLEEEPAVGALNGSFPEPNETPTAIKLEQVDYNDNARLSDIKTENTTDDDVASCSNACALVDTAEQLIKKEKEDAVASEENATSLPELDLSPFISAAEFKQEESEIVEVLWKQDVDLGYSLTPKQVLNATEPQIADETNELNEELEKLKALEELKIDKPKNDKEFDFNAVEIDDEWAGIPFTIDNETGEYIRLPLDELFKDVLQLEALQEESQTNNDLTDLVGASTSQAAVAAAASASANNNNNNKQLEEQIKDDENKKLATAYKKESNNNNNNNNNSVDNLNVVKNKDDQSKQKEETCGDFDDDLPSPLFDLDDEAREELAEFDMMIQSAAATFHHHHHHSPHPHGGRAPTAVQNYAAVGGGANSAFHRQTSASGFHHHGHHHQGRIPLSRSVSMEQHLQDIANLFNPMPSMNVADMPPYAAYAPHPYSYQSAAPQHGQYPTHPPPPPPHARHTPHHSMLHANAALSDICAPPQPHYGHNLGSAVSSSMHLTNASHEADVGLGASGGVPNSYKMEPEMMYYSNTSSEMNHTTDGFINSILNDEDLHLMDMNVNNDFCRMVDVNNSSSNNSSVLGAGANSAGNNALSMNTGSGTTGAANNGMTADLMNSQQAVGGSSGAGIGAAGDRLDASSDSAVSSMGSERVPSLSDGEWGEGSDSAQDYHQGKYGGPYDYSYNNNNNTATHNRLNEVGARQPPVAQKKHQMFGKRYFNEQTATPPSVSNATAAIVTPATAAQGLLHAVTPSIKYEYEPYAMSVGPPPPPMSGANLPQAQVGLQSAATELQHGYELKYSGVGVSPYSLDFSLRSPRTALDIAQHNHTYSLPQGNASMPRPQQRDKKHGSASSGKCAKMSTGCSSGLHAAAIAHDDEHLTRDEKRARALNIPIVVNDIINLPMDEFNERLSKYDLNENQLSLIRDIRRRGKNKVAAQNCRKRKLDQILSLEDEVKEVRRRKDQLQQQREELYTERKRISNKFASLHRHIFQYLRDPEGNPCSPTDYSLQLATDGSVYLLPRDSSNVSDAIAPITTTTAGRAQVPHALQQHQTQQQAQSLHQQHMQQQQQQPTHNGTMHQQSQQQHHVHPKE